MPRANKFRAGLLLSTLVLGTAAGPVFDVAWRKTDHDRVGKNVSAYFEAFAEKKGVADAWEDFSSSVEKLEKKYPNVLTYTEDWERVFRAEAISHCKARPKKAKIVEETFDFRGDKIDTALHFPKTYSTKGDPYPFFLIACDANTDPKAQLEEWANATVRDTAILCAVRMPSNVELIDKLGDESGPGGITFLMASFGTLKADYAIDMNRVFIAGHGEGARAALVTAAAFPHQFAGVVARNGGADVKATNFLSLPTLWLASGEAGTKFEEAAGEAGMENVTVSGSASDDEIAAWIDGKSRDAYPLHVKFEPVNERSLATRWIAMSGASPDAESKLEAKVDREANTITIDAENIVSVNLYLNDVLVDLSQPVKVVINGRTEEALIARNQRTMVDLQYYGGDWGRVFTATESFDITE